MPPIISTLTFAHRVARDAHDRESALEAFRTTMDAGVKGLEADVRLSGDGVPVLAHDAAVRRGVRRLKVGSTTSEELVRHGIPRLDDLYAAVGTDLEVSLDVKVPDAGFRALETVRRQGADAVGRLWLCSADLDFLRRVRDVDSAVHLVHSTSRRDVSAPLERHAATLAEHGIEALNLHRTEWSRGLVVLFQRFGVLAFAWDAHNTRHLDEVLSYGVDAVYGDDARLLARAVGIASGPHGETNDRGGRSA